MLVYIALFSVYIELYLRAICGVITYGRIAGRLVRVGVKACEMVAEELLYYSERATGTNEKESLL